jgi:gliding motility-associated-like protein
MRNLYRILVGFIFMSLLFLNYSIACVTPAPPSANNVTITCGDSAVLVASGSTGDYIWYADQAGTIQIGTGSPFTTPNLSSDTTFYVTAFDPPNCESSTVQVNIIVNPIPNPVAIANPSTVLCGSTSILEVTNPNTNSVYTWFDDPAGVNTVGGGSSFTTPPLNNTTTYYVQESSGIGGTQLFSFTNASATGATGPTQAMVNSEYSGTNLAGNVNVIGSGIQQWVVPFSGLYTITAAGARGGGANGGNGAEISGEFNLTGGQVINIVVGQMGQTFSNDRNVSGGGGSYVIVDGSNDILVIAGGGGGGRNAFPNSAGQITPEGENGIDNGGVDGVGGAGGNGGGAASCRGGGGGGFLTNGLNGGCSLPNGQGGFAYLNGSSGGVTGNAVDGGFGGGGAVDGVNSSWTYAGGGGGYSGGGGASSSGQNSRGGGGGSFNSGLNPNNIAGANNGHGFVNIEIIGTGGCLSDLVPVTINVDPLTFNISGSTDPSACGIADGTITLSGLEPNTAYDVSFNGGSASSISSDASGNVVITGLGAGNYNDFEVEVAGCVANVSQLVTLVEPNAPTVDAGPDQTVCLGDSITLTAVNPQSATITWDQGVTDNTPFVPAVGVNTYTVTAALNNCIGTDQVEITVLDLPNVSAGANQTVCQGDPVTLTADNPDGANISWDQGVQDGVSFTPGTTGPITYTVTADLSGCINTDEVIVEVVANPTFAANGNDLSSCTTNDGSVEITGLNPNAIYDVEINGAPAISVTMNASGATTFNNLAPGTYTYVITDLNGCSSLPVSVTINALDGPQIVFQVVTDESCFGEEDGAIDLTIDQGTPPFNYVWAPNVGTGPNVSDLPPGTYQLTISDASNCVTIETFTIEAATELTMTGTSSDAFCNDNDGQINLTVNGGSQPYTFNWNSPNASGENPNNLPPGDYDVTVVDANGCSVSDSFVVGQEGSLSVQAFPNEATIQQGSEINLSANVASTSSNLTYLWSPGDGLSCTDCADPVASPDETTTYVVTVIDEVGCSGTDTVEITVVEPCIEIQFPTIFTPNGDGMHDFFCILGDCITSGQLNIYNRWGEVVFSTADITECWDGTHRDKPVNAGVFVYRLRYNDENNIQKMISGNITVLR